jgi:hypothetical protein
MVEYVGTRYARLFDVQVLHHFWIDEGATVFDAIADADAKRERLLRYDVRRLLAIEPSRSTATMIAGLGGVFCSTGLGFVVAVPHDSVVPADRDFEFFATVARAEFSDYTSLSLRSQQVVSVVDPGSGRIRLYKSNVPVLSNVSGAARVAGGAKRLFLSREYATGGGDGVESFFVAGGVLRQLTGDPPGAQFQALGASDQLPVYVHQGDVPAIVPPPGATGAPARGIEVSTEMPRDVTAVIRLAPVRTDDNDFSLIGANGRPRTPSPVFEVHLKNRSTTWRYRDKSDGTIISTEPVPLPLTYFGNAGTKHKPSTGAIGVEFDNSVPSKVIRLVSEIYV